MKKLTLNLALLSSLLFFHFNIQAETFRFAVLPDTQIYSDWQMPGAGRPITDPEGSYHYYPDQTQWIADNASQLNIKQVVHLGDVVQDGNNLEEWERAKAAMNILDDADVPYGVVLGNHDLSRDNGRSFDQFYLDYFGPQYYQDKPWYGGASPSGGSNYQIIEHQDYGFIFINLSLGTPLEELKWASEILNEHSDKLAILSTHAYIWDYRVGSARYGEELDTGLMAALGFAGERIYYEHDSSDAARIEAQEFYDSFIREHTNIIMIMCGHVHAELYRTDGVNGAGLPVYEILTDYQNGRNGGDGYMRIYEVDVENNRIEAYSYSPSLDRRRTTFEGFVESITVVDEYARSQFDFPAFIEDFMVSLFRKDVVKGVDVIAQNPEYQEEPEYYRQLLADLQGGEVPEDLGQIEDWESLWMLDFAVDRKNPLDFSGNERATEFEMPINFDDYVNAEYKPRDPAQEALDLAKRKAAGLIAFVEDVLLLVFGLV